MTYLGKNVSPKMSNNFFLKRGFALFLLKKKKKYLTDPLFDTSLLEQQVYLTRHKLP